MYTSEQLRHSTIDPVNPPYSLEVERVVALRVDLALEVRREAHVVVVGATERTAHGDVRERSASFLVCAGVGARRDALLGHPADSRLFCSALSAS